MSVRVSSLHLKSIAIISPFVGLRRFPQGRGFKQWTGDDSKALMKVSKSGYWHILRHGNGSIGLPSGY
jgi:hypothetical protein